MDGKPPDFVESVDDVTLNKYRRAGKDLSAYLLRAGNPSIQQVEAFLADTLAGDDLLQAMKDAAKRPSFKELQGLAGSGLGTIQRDMFLQELARIYLPEVVDNIGRLINGMLDADAEDLSSSSKAFKIEAGLSEDPFIDIAKKVLASSSPWKLRLRMRSRLKGYEHELNRLKSSYEQVLSRIKSGHEDQELSRLKSWYEQELSRLRSRYWDQEG